MPRHTHEVPDEDVIEERARLDEHASTLGTERRKTLPALPPVHVEPEKEEPLVALVKAPPVPVPSPTADSLREGRYRHYYNQRIARGTAHVSITDPAGDSYHFKVERGVLRIPAELDQHFAKGPDWQRFDGQVQDVDTSRLGVINDLDTLHAHHARKGR